MPYANTLGTVVIGARMFRTLDGTPITREGLKDAAAITIADTPTSVAEIERAKRFLEIFAKSGIGDIQGPRKTHTACSLWWAPRSVSYGAVLFGLAELGFDLIHVGASDPSVEVVASVPSDAVRPNDDFLGMVSVHAHEDAS